MKEIKMMSDEELRNEIEAMDQQISDIGCFGVKDLIWQRELEAEADNRDLENGGEE